MADLKTPKAGASPTPGNLGSAGKKEPPRPPATSTPAPAKSTAAKPAEPKKATGTSTKAASTPAAKSTATAKSADPKKSTGTAKQTSTAAKKTTPAAPPPRKPPPVSGQKLTVVERRKYDAANSADQKMEQSIGRVLAEPEKLVDFMFNRPSWIDELTAIALIVFGLVSLLSLINTESASLALSSRWSDFIRQIFGDVGAKILSLMIIAGGTIIVLPRIGIKIYNVWQRILYFEMAFFGFLAFLHLTTWDAEPRALARMGGGGGYVGWALSQAVRNLFGSGFAIAFFGLFALVCLMAAVGIRRSHVRSFLKKRLDTVSSVSQGVAQRMKAVPAAFDTQKIMAALVQPPKEREKRPRVTPRRRSTPIPELMQPAQDTAGTAQDSPQIAASVRPIRPATATGTSPEAPALRPIVSRAAMNEDVPEPESLPPVQRIGTGTSIGANTGANTGSSLPPIRRAEPAANANPTAEPEAALTPGIRRPVPIGRNPIRDTDQSTDQTGQQIGQQIGQPSDPQTGQPAASLANQEDAEPALPAPIAPKPVSTPVRARKEKPEKPAPPPRVRRTFAVSDFEEDRRVLPREGLPPLRLLADTELNKPTEQEINANARIIEDTLLEFDIDVEVVEVRVGPTVTQYGVQPFREVINEQGETVLQRVRVTKIQSYSDDLALALAAKRLRIEPYVPGHQYMGIEVPNRTPSVVALRPVLESESFAKAYIKSDPDSPTGTREAPLTVPLGRDVSGSSVIVDLATMPHVLIAGTTGSGKSVCITTLIAALVMNNTPDRVKLVMLDPKRVELSRFNGLPHLLGPVETDIEQIIGVLRWATREMDRRYKLLEGAATRNIEIYNRAVSTGEITTERLPYIVIFVDEIGDLMLSRPDETERTLTRLAQMARAVGMHLVVATQRPSVDIITGLIKANFPARISFAVTSGMDSRVILDATGAETLIGKGDMLYQASDAGGPRRVQGCFASDEEIDELVRWWIDWKARQGAATDAPPWERGLTRREALSEGDPLLEDAIALVVRDGEASPSMLQRQLGIDYRRAANLIDSLTELGVIGKLKEGGRREVLIKPGTKQYKALLESQRNKGG